MHFFQPIDPWSPPGFVLPVPVDPAGLSGPTKGQARGPRWRRTSENRYVPVALDGTVPEQRIAEAAGNLRAKGALTGWPALRLRGARYLDGRERNGVTPRPVPLVMGPSNARRERDGIRFLHDRLEPVVDVRGLPCMPTRRALFDEMRTQRRLFDAVVAVDMCVLARLTTIEAMLEYVEKRAGWAGVPLVRKALALADAHSASPPETRLRLFWEASMKLPRLLVNVGVFDLEGRFIGYPDLLDLDAGLVIEYDGVDHLPEERQSKDADREGDFRDLGLEVVHVVSRDMWRPKILTTRLRSARARSRFEPEVSRRWTVEPERPRYCPRSCSCRGPRLVGQ